MTRRPALHTHFLATLTSLLNLALFFLYEVWASWLRTPHQIRVCIDLKILFKLLKLLVNFLRAKLLDCLLGETFGAA